MKTERRHELQTNVLSNWLGEQIEILQPYSRAITATILGAAVLVGVYFFFTRQAALVDQRAWDDYLNAINSPNIDSLEDVVSRYEKTTVGTWAHLRLADVKLNEGIKALFENRSEARANLRAAVENYQFVLDHTREDLLLERATFGLARAYESQNDLAKARELYKKLEEWEEGVYVAAATKRLTDLGRKPTKLFYDWFDKQNPKSLEDEPGEPGKKLPFDDSGLDDEPTFGKKSSKKGKDKDASAFDDESTFGKKSTKKGQSKDNSDDEEPFARFKDKDSQTDDAKGKKSADDDAQEGDSQGGDSTSGDESSDDASDDSSTNKSSDEASSEGSTDEADKPSSEESDSSSTSDDAPE